MKAAIIGAMEEEVAILRSRMEGREETVIAGCEFSKGSLDGVEAVLLKSGIGKVNAAMGTTLLLDRFRPDFVINTGSAGGFLPSLRVGDLVISEEVVHHDVDVTAFGYAYGQVPGLPERYRADEALVEAAKQAAARLDGLQAVTGLIATGDSFMNDPTRVEFVRGQFPELCAVEMEAAAIAQVCVQFGTPFVIIRALSDIAGEESNVSFEQFLETAAKHSAELVLSMLSVMKQKRD
ncbi:5'-methylthioadenosine/S-adenosylhomocysteine nucleosidase [Geobacillus thermocatenulatus]|uniref:5'-methylthioadenosine/S-adenosylhomocysteine nucleosidase n=1 Tax=Geobacillus thermocatenulatus TaxID=33938 RepID=UPI0004734B74|nr:5'-methylthioadenosine/S-adenosylhomocysteine nucleosidase [Geobacillus thermocatenulatus]KPD01707.1 5'-methylthioadenosine/S-adenosylhomocysteine nucleosidase [Geobacillus sp. BCO2]